MKGAFDRWWPLAAGIVPIAWWLVVSPVNVAAQSAESGEAEQAAQAPPPSREWEVEPPRRDTSGGLWPTAKLMNLMLDRWGDQIGETYQLNDDQRTRVREQVRERWGLFLQENRESIEPLVMEFLELRMEMLPPDKEAVQSWANRTLPVFEQMRAQIRGTNSDLRKILTPGQRVRFEADALKFAAGMQFAEQEIKQWASGEFDPRRFWEPPASAREDRKRRFEERRARRERFRREGEEREAASTTPSPPEDQVEIELGLWDKHAAEFIEKYSLDEGQKSTIQSILAEMKERATAHRDRHRTEIAELETRIQQGGGDGDREAIKQKLTELYGPIDDMFAELQRRMQAVPTREQLARAETALKESAAPSAQEK